MSNTTNTTNSTEKTEGFSFEYVSNLKKEIEALVNQGKEKKKAKAPQSETRTADDGGISSPGRDRILRAELKVEAIKAGLLDLDMLKLIDLSKLSLKDDGVDGLDEALAALKSSKPALFGSGNTSSSAAAPKAGPLQKFNALKAKNDELADRLAEHARRKR
jgi:hypothetical protein